MAIGNASHPDLEDGERSERIFTERLKDWRELLVDLQKRLCGDVVAIALANRGALGRDPLDWANECVDNFWATRRVGFKNWAVLGCDWAEPERWSAPGWLLSQVPQEILNLHIQAAPLAETLDGRVFAPYTKVILEQIASLIEMRLFMARTAVFDDAKIKIASEPVAKRGKQSASSVERVNEAVYAIGRRYGNEWDRKWLESTLGLYAELHAKQTEHSLDESLPKEPEVPKLKLIEPLLPMFIAETREPIPVWIRANEGPHTGLMADFSNPPGATGRRSIPARGVIARVVYRGTHGERLTMNSCCWLDRSEQRIDYEPGEMHKLVLAVVSEGDQRVFALGNRRSQVPIEGSRDPGIMPTPLGELPFKAELVLIDEQGRTVFKAEFLLERDRGKIITARKLEPAQSDADAVIGTAQVVAENTVRLTGAVNKTAPTNTDSAEKSLEPFEGVRTDLEVAKDSTGITGSKKKRGPQAKMEFHQPVAEVVNSCGPNWKEHLERIAEKLDKRKIPTLRKWAQRDRPARTWRRAVEYYPELVVKALAYSLKMAAKDKSGKSSQTLANSR